MFCNLNLCCKAITPQREEDNHGAAVAAAQTEASTENIKLNFNIVVFNHRTQLQLATLMSNATFAYAPL